MVFSSMVFVFLFFALNILVHNMCGSMRAKNAAMLIFSLVFYSWAGIGFTVVMLIDVFVCWIFALRIEQGPEKHRRLMLASCVAVVLLILGFFKYTKFLFYNLNVITGLQTPGFVGSILLPVGISFYTFQLISYVADVYRREVKAQRSFRILLLYACLFHQCVAGPIVRYSDIEHEIMDRKATLGATSRGISRFTVGLAKKAILANSCAAIADTYFNGDAGALAAQPAAALWLAGFAFMLEIYLDFSAYSDMAIGMGLMCGFHYRENFNYPYIADSVTDFWRRWHMSLSGFFRDYVYIPLGGNRRGRGRQIFNLFVVWSLTGFWHGASWNYIIWGVYFFIFLAAEKFLLGEKIKSVPLAVRHVAVLLIVYFSWIIFKFEDIGELLTVLRGMFGMGADGASSFAVLLDLRANFILLTVAAIATTPIPKKISKWIRGHAKDSGVPFALWSAFEVCHPVLLLFLSATALAGNSYNPFLYFIF